MSDYDFRTLSPYDFELLCHDALEAELGLKLEVFKPGRDTGIDLRHAFSDGEQLVVQCKHFVQSGYAKLVRVLAQEEKQKLDQLAPLRYVVATSVGLTPGNASAIVAAVNPHCKSTGDVFGCERLNQILRARPGIVRAHFKLWLTSEAVLTRILHNGTFVKTLLDRNEMRTKLNLFVQTGAVPKAAALLEKEHACIITGEPGIGKTTVAQILIAKYLSEEWELVSAGQNVRELLDVYHSNPDSRQILYYDDFLGQVNLHDTSLAKNEDRTILQLLTQIRTNPHKRFILTTREYILRQAQENSEQLKHGPLDVNKFLLSLDDYSMVDRAMILANHLHFYGVPAEFVASILKDQGYVQIIKHKNYNPRIIEHLTSPHQIGSMTPAAYMSEFLRNLDHPDIIWKHAFNKKLSRAAKNLLFVLTSCPPDVSMEHLRIAFSAFHGARARDYNFSVDANDFSEALEVLENSFIKIGAYGEGRLVRVQNPSVMDFLTDQIRQDPMARLQLLNASEFFEQIQRLLVIVRNPGEKRFLAIAEIPHLAEFQSAAVRLYPATSCRVTVNGWSKPPSFKQVPIDLIERLSLLIDFVGATNDDLSKQVVRAAIQQHFANPQMLGYESLELLDGLANTDLVSDTTIHQWCEAAEMIFENPIGDVDEALGWMQITSRLPYQFSDDALYNMSARVFDAAETQCDDLTQGTDADEIEKFLKKLKEFEKYIWVDFSGLVRRLMNAQEEIHDKKRNYRDDRDEESWPFPVPTRANSEVGNRPQPTTFTRLRSSFQTKIDRIFDSLNMD